MRIGLIGPYPPQPTGGATHVAELEDMLRKKGHFVQVITLGSGKKIANVYHIPFLPIPIVRGLFFILFGTLVVLNAVRKHQLEILHAHFLFPYGFVSSLCGKIMRVPTVITCHGSDVLILPKSPFYKALIKWTADSADALIFVGKRMRLHAQQIGISTRLTLVVPSGISIDKFTGLDSRNSARRQLNLPSKTHIVLLVARLIEIKRIDLAIKALKEVLNVHPNTKLLVVGDGPLRSKFEKLSRDVGVYEHVRFEGPISYDRIPTYYKACDIFILPSDSEGLPIVLLEAMASKRLVIASSVGDIPDLISNGVNGFLMNPGDEEDLARTISCALSPTQDLQPIIDAGFKTACKYDWDMRVEEIEQLYSKVRNMADLNASGNDRRKQAS